MTKAHIALLVEALNKNGYKVNAKQVSVIITNHSCENWRHKLSAREIARVIKMCQVRVRNIGRLLIKWGYDEPVTIQKAKEERERASKQLFFSPRTAKKYATMQNVIINKKSDRVYAD